MVIATINRLWPGQLQLDEAGAEAWYVVGLRELAYSDALEAIQRLVRTPRAFAPNISELLRASEPAAGAPSWGEVQAHLSHDLAYRELPGRPEYSEAHNLHLAHRVARAAERYHPAVAQWLGLIGLGSLRLAALDPRHPSDSYEDAERVRTLAASYRQAAERWERAGRPLTSVAGVAERLATPSPRSGDFASVVDGLRPQRELES